MKLEASWAEKITTHESDGAEIVALGAPYGAGLAANRIITPSLTPEGSSIAAAR